MNDIAIASVLFEGDVTRNGKQIHFRGKELLVWKKQADGSWKIFRYMFDEIPAKKELGFTCATTHSPLACRAARNCRIISRL